MLIAILSSPVNISVFFIPHENFHSFGVVYIAGDGLQILTTFGTYGHWNSEGSLACHTFCGTRHPFIMVISEDP